jgi:hypothetical protein
VAERYRCKKGKYDPEKRECKEKGWKVFDITLDAEHDPPSDIVKFQAEWEDDDDDVWA